MKKHTTEKLPQMQKSAGMANACVKSEGKQTNKNCIINADSFSP